MSRINLSILSKIQQYIREGKSDINIETIFSNVMGEEEVNLIFNFATSIIRVFPLYYSNYAKLVRYLYYKYDCFDLYYYVDSTQTYHDLLTSGFFDVHDIGFPALMNNLMFIKNDNAHDNIKTINDIYHMRSNECSQYKSLLSKYKNCKESDLDDEKIRERSLTPIIEPYAECIGFENFMHSELLRCSLFNRRVAGHHFDSLTEKEKLLVTFVSDDYIFHEKLKDNYIPFDDFNFFSLGMSHRLYKFLPQQGFDRLLITAIANLNFTLLDLFINIQLDYTPKEILIRNSDLNLSDLALGRLDVKEKNILYEVLCSRNRIFGNIFHIANTLIHFKFSKRVEESVFVSGAFQNNVHKNVFQLRNKDVESVATFELKSLNHVMKFFKKVSFYRAFSYCNNLRSIKFPPDFDTFNVYDVNLMFDKSPKLKLIDISSFDLTNVKDMSRIISLDESDFYLRELVNILRQSVESKNKQKRKEFCEKLSDDFDITSNNDCICLRWKKKDSIRIDLSILSELDRYLPDVHLSFSGMFSCCKNLRHVSFPDIINTECVIDMSLMFNDCHSLVKIDFGPFTTSNVTNMSKMFSNCYSLSDLDLSFFDTSRVSNMREMFSGCTSLRCLNITSFNTYNVTDATNMFKDCDNLSVLIWTSKNLNQAVAYLIDQIMDNSFRKIHELYHINQFTVDSKQCARITWRNKSVQVINEEHVSMLLALFSKFDMLSFEKTFIKCTDLTRFTFPTNFLDTTKIVSFASTFEGCASLRYLGFGTIITSNVVDMSMMFRDCSSLITLDLASFDTQNVMHMNSMFERCSSLASIDIRSFNTSRVDDMSSMFRDCSELKEINLESFDTFRVVYMSYMFSGCSNLKSVDLSTFNTSKVQDMTCMFLGCSQIAKVDMSTLDLSNVMSLSEMFSGCSMLAEVIFPICKMHKLQTMKGMFSDCSVITEIDLSPLETSNIRDMSYLFNRCSQLQKVDLKSFSTVNVTDMSHMFNGCCNLFNVDLDMFNTLNVRDMSYMFYSCTRIENLDITSFNTKSVNKHDKMFEKCERLEKVDYDEKSTKESITESIQSLTLTIPHELRQKFSVLKSYTRSGRMIEVTWRDKKSVEINGSDLSVLSSLDVFFDVISFRGMFHECKKLKKVTFPDELNTSKVIDMSSMFEKCHKLETIDFKHIDTSNVTDMSSMFDSCSRIQTLDLQSFNTSKVLNMNGLFNGCTSLTRIDISKFNTEHVETMNSMFQNCLNLVEVDIQSFDTRSVKDMSFMFNQCPKIKSILAGQLDTSKVTNFRGIFHGCSAIEEIDMVSTFNTSSAENMSDMFSECANLQCVDLTSFDTDNVTTMKNMFYKCQNLRILDMSSFNTQNVTDMTHMFDSCKSLTTLNISLFSLNTVEKIDHIFMGCDELSTIFCNQSTEEILTERHLIGDNVMFRI